MQHHVAGFARESEDEVGAAGESVLVDKIDGVFGAVEVVTTVDTLQSAVVNGFHSEFYNNMTNTTDALQHFKDFLGDAVGAGADDETDYVCDGEGFAIELL